jgi:hypothetical protein
MLFTFEGHAMEEYRIPPNVLVDLARCRVVAFPVYWMFALARRIPNFPGADEPRCTTDEVVYACEAGTGRW